MAEYVYAASACREIDRTAMQALNLSGTQLMERAADAAWVKLSNTWPSARRISLYCGPGNNGGDGYLLAAIARKLGYAVRVWSLAAPLTAVAQAAQQRALEQGVEIQLLVDEPQFNIDPHTDLIVDALFGHGLSRAIEGPLAALIEHLNKQGKPIFALDMPSGINSDTGAIMGTAIRALATLSFVAPKIGLLTGDGPDYAGQIWEETLGVPKRIRASVKAACERITVETLRHRLPVPRVASHKGNFGHVAIVGGQPGMVGAVILAALAAARSGAGRVTVLSDIDHIHLIQQANPVLMTQAAVPGLSMKLGDSITATALGPGLGTGSGADDQGEQSNWSRALFESILTQSVARDLPLVVDADGLNLLALKPRRYGRWVLTPHPKEAAGLLGISTAEVQSNRPLACRRIAQKYAGICVLKGNGSLVSDGSGRDAVCSYGNWGMATAGSGDVLSGVVSALLASGMESYDAACVAVGIHAMAGDCAAEKLAKRSMIASDLVSFLAPVFRQLED